MGLVVVVVKPLFVMWFLFPLTELIAALRLVCLLAERSSVALGLRTHLDLTTDFVVVLHVSAFFCLLQ